jgi:hypothetical protein
MDLGSGLDAAMEIPCACLESNPGRPARSYTDWAIPAPMRNKVRTKPSLCLIKNHATKTHQGSWCKAPRFSNYRTSWKWAVSFTPRPHYFSLGKREEHLPLTGIETQFAGLDGSSLVTVLTWDIPDLLSCTITDKWLRNSSARCHSYSGWSNWKEPTDVRRNLFLCFTGCRVYKANARAVYFKGVFLFLCFFLLCSQLIWC